MYKINKIKTRKSLKYIRENSVSFDVIEKSFSKKDLNIIDKYIKEYDLLFKIREERRKKRLTQEKLARLANLPRTTITKIESGRRNVTIATLLSIARALGKELVIEFR